jgi:hypothetical protein
MTSTDGQEGAVSIDRLGLLTLTFLLTGCATTGTYVSPGPAPTKQEAERVILDGLRRVLKDPDSLKQFAMDPFPKQVQWYRGLINGGGQEAGWMWCFEYNAKNSYGGYAGLTRDGATIRVEGGSAVLVGGIMYPNRC